MKRILVVDDQPNNVFILRDRLKHENFEVLTAYNGPEAIDLAEKESPDLILLDVMMPEMDGFEVCSILTRQDLTKNIPIILLTALTSPQDIENGLQSGAYDYIKKPFNKVELIARINSALRFSEARKILLEMEKIRTFSATIVTANHEIKQPLTLINLSTTAIKRELKKEAVGKEAVERKVFIIEEAIHKIIEVLDKLSSIKTPKFTDYVEDVKMIDIESENSKNV